MKLEKSMTQVVGANGRTVVLEGSLTRMVPPVAPREAFVAAFESLRRLAKVAPPGAWVVAVVDAMRRPMGAIMVRPGGVCVLGRHTECDLEIELPDIALRHLALHVSLAARDGASTMRAWDLHTDFRFATEDGVEAAAASADGPMFLGLGMFRILCLPAAPLGHTPADAAELAWEVLAPRVHIDALRASDPATASPRAEAPLEVEPTESRVHLARRSVITRLPEAVGATIGSPPASTPPADALATLIVQSAQGSDELHVTPEMLRRGILIGRYQRCLNAIDADISLSRVHVLIALHGDVPWIIDTASTNGTISDGLRLQAAPLAGPQIFLLGHETLLAWRPITSAA
jgi:hypothetical protein